VLKRGTRGADPLDNSPGESGPGSAERTSDMTTIKASCPVCGDVELTPAQVRLVVCTRPEWSYYAFTCTRCTDEVRKPADEQIIALLASGGVVAEHWTIPAEALEEHVGPRISYDDILDFVLALESVDVVGEVTGRGWGVAA
jgi:hypothetical protein